MPTDTQKHDESSSSEKVTSTERTMATPRPDINVDEKKQELVIEGEERSSSSRPADDK